MDGNGPDPRSFSSATAPEAAVPANNKATNKIPAINWSPSGMADGSGVRVRISNRTVFMCHRKAMPANGTR